MAKLTCLNSVSQWEREQISKYPEAGMFIKKLKNNIMEKPEKGLLDPIIFDAGRNLPCRKQSVSISLFSNRYAIGYSYIVATYLYNEDNVVIVKLDYS